ncbi:HAD family hydrolase [Clostridium grantii]|uniref:Phosphoglycolate phosphatase n=1 Tax=Clostridium grantii DSM 8605 TaxID=1121316 RepID=A0A1M5UC23_9CLOT|nr:HAD-IA family hydrolase [Clostridium grantii]SHH60562.1 phosphoglycolate phosphatase [Clostridium grantii DSM 8605]
MIKHIIFDLDGTLINSIGGLAYSMNKVLEKYNLPQHTQTTYKSYIGNGMKKLVERSLPHNYDTYFTLDKAHKLMISNYEKFWQEDLFVYDDIFNLLRELKEKGFTYSILTNKKETFAKEIVDKLFTACGFQGVFGEVNNMFLKPNKEAIERIVKTLKINTNECILVGDSEVDIKACQNANILSVACTWGFRDKIYLKSLSPKYLIDTPLELIEILLNLK